MRRIWVGLAALVTAIALALPAGASAKTCAPGYTHGVIGGEQKCLRRGEYCSHWYTSQYHKYGFNCVYISGAYHLEPRRSE